ncbi:uncharacterized protein LOC112598038 isoform X1 [Melanaphis sacchari]|uniref:uncharacterized protein LOC112598038 isoform X1 n=1 Tax=Melanaphis sacchari TaxID=742174 RepID=UPI000DC1551E|nr:uncharacterized protein LOC112598038 isoform X1 [Melanaphis sacchari]XP_025200136.1 uncharacterized protein LOC112598038 isoform X1 [Melanaphis sacchari]
MSEHRKHSRISVMQMFHELKQQFPTVPDQVVSDCILKHSTNREACVSNLKSVQKNYVQQTYPSDIVDKMANRPKSLEMSQNNLSLPKLQFLNRPQQLDGTKDSINSNRSDIDNTQILDIDFNINRCQCSSVSAPSTPSQQHQGENRHKSCLSLDSVPFVDTQCRPFTSVSLTLRTPTKDPLPPLDLSAGGGSELTYTACSFDPTTDPKNCYQSRLHISIDPEGETTVTTSRVMVSPTNIKSINRMTEIQLPGPVQIDNILPKTKMVINAQLERKQKLASELLAEKQRLEIMKKNVALMEEDISKRRSYSRKIERLRNDVELLRIECNKLAVQVDTASENQVPLDTTNKQFYNKIYTGQKISFGKMHKEYQEHSENQNWVCPMCTFQNHPILPRCEQCDMARFDLGKPQPYPGNIHVRVTHRLNHQRKTTSLY